MKVEMYGKDHYSGAVTFTQRGEVRPVTEEVGNYLLSTFPQWFRQVKDEQPKTEREVAKVAEKDFTPKRNKLFHGKRKK